MKERQHNEKVVRRGVGRPRGAKSSARSLAAKAEEQFRILIDAAPMPIASISRKGGVEHVTPKFTEMFGYSAEDMPDLEAWAALAFPDTSYRDKVARPLREAVGRSLRGANAIPPADVMIACGNGSVRHVQMDAAVVDRRMLISFFDKTELKQIEEALRKSEMLLLQMQRMAHIGSWDWNIATNSIMWSGEMFRIAGLPRQAATPELMISSVHPEDRERVLDAIRAALRGEQPFSLDLRIVRPDGQVRFVHDEGEVVRDDQGNAVSMFGTAQDITGRKHLEAEVLRSQKMETIGQLTGGIAHDYNNLLNAIIGYSSIIQMSMAPEDQNRNHIEQVLRAADRAAELTQSLLAFSRRQEAILKHIDLNAVVARAGSLVGRLLGDDIGLKVSTQDGTLPILGDSSQIEQMLVNLVTNARDAMPGGGMLSIRTRTFEMDQAYLTAHGFGRAGRYAELLVSDTGTGMDKETAEKVFEPFFTTREPGRGVGLGLATVYEAVKQHKGYITVYSEPGKGSAFAIYFPLAAQEGLDEKTAEQPVAPMQGKGETVLVAEDDEMLRNYAWTVLSEYGYEVLLAGDGDEALRLFEEHRDKIDLCILDIIMPNKSGKDVYDEISKARPGIRTIFVSGYPADLLDQTQLPGPDLPFLLKPVASRELLTAVRRTLDS